MKITMCFEATSMAHLKDQLLQAFGSISVGDDVSKTPITDHVIAKTAQELMGNQNKREHFIQTTAEIMKKGVDKTAQELIGLPVITSELLENISTLNAKYGKIAAPSVYGELANEVPSFITPQHPEVKVEIGHLAKSEDVPQKETLDGYTVSNGQVWVPVEGRSSAFTGIPMERYLAQKAAKEAGAELDSKGTPYDANIHTATKLKTQSGEWKKKPVRGSKTEAAQPQWQPPVATQAPPVQIPVTNEPTVAIPFTQFPPAEQAQQTPVIESLAPAIGNAPPMHSYESFKKNLGKITMILANQGKIDRNYLMQLAAHFGVNEIWDIVEPKHEANCRILYNSFIEHGLILGA